MGQLLSPSSSFTQLANGFAKLPVFSFRALTTLRPQSMTMRSLFIWLHGLGDSGEANEPIIKEHFTSLDFNTTKWSFPTAPFSSVTCNDGALMHSWFDIYDWPIDSDLKKDEKGLLKAVDSVHAIIDNEVAAGIRPENIVVCGLSQGGSLAIASVLLYPKTLGGCAVLSGWIPFSSSSFIRRITPEATKTPILWIHGKVDATVLFSAGEAGLAFLRKARINCEFKDYPNLGHSLCDEELQYLESWISKRLKGESLLMIDNKEKQQESKKNQGKSRNSCLCFIFSWNK